MKLKKENKAFRITFLALMLAFYCVLNYVSIDLQVFKISFVGIPIILVAILYGPIDAGIIALAAELVGQMFPSLFSTFAPLEPSTPLWLIGPVVRAVLVGLFFKERDPIKEKVRWAIVVVGSGLVLSIINTGALFVYFEYVLDLPEQARNIALGFRFLGSVATSIIYIFVIPLFTEVLKKLNKVENKEETKK